MFGAQDIARVFLATTLVAALGCGAGSVAYAETQRSAEEPAVGGDASAEAFADACVQSLESAVDLVRGQAKDAVKANKLKAALKDAKAVDADEYLDVLDKKVSWKRCKVSTYGIGDGLMGSGCADGSKVTKTSMGVAHKTLALGTKIQIKYNDKIVNAVVCDRGPYVSGRELDLQPAVAWALGVDGVASLSYRVL